MQVDMNNKSTSVWYKSQILITLIVKKLKKPHLHLIKVEEEFKYSATRKNSVFENLGFYLLPFCSDFWYSTMYSLKEKAII